MKKKKYLITLIIFILFILNAYLINIYYIKPYLKPRIYKPLKADKRKSSGN